MNIYYAEYDLDIKIGNNDMIAGICIEDPVSFRNFIDSIYAGLNGNESRLYITENDKEIKLDKNIELIVNSFSIDINNKRILAKLYQDMKDIADQEFYEDVSTLNTAIVNFIDKINEKIEYPIDYKLNLDIQQLFKNYEVKIDSTNVGLPEQLLDYIKLCHKILNIRLFFLAHSEAYFSEKELIDFFDTLKYEDVKVILIENRFESKICNENWWIIDKDNCLITV